MKRIVLAFIDFISQWLRVRARIVNYFGYGYGIS